MYITDSNIACIMMLLRARMMILVRYSNEDLHLVVILTDTVSCILSVHF